MAGLEARLANLSSVLQLLAASSGPGPGQQRLRVGPGTAVTPPITAPAAARLPSGWPQPELPPQPLRLPEAARRGLRVVLVALFDLDETEVLEAVRQLAFRKQDWQAFVPVILTNMAAQGIFRRQGLLVEYFPEAIVADTGFEWFRGRLELLWYKWGASALIDLSRAGYLEARTAGLSFLEPSQELDPAEKPWIRRTSRPVKPPTADIAALIAEAASKGLLEGPDSFVMYRIIGNDLYPRHEPGQSLQNLRFILDNEPRHAGLERRWVLNRIIDPEEEAALAEQLEAAGEPVLRLGFDINEYAACDWDLDAFANESFLLFERPANMSERRHLRAQTRARRHKINYAMNNNGARNAALHDGRGRARWILPWDGNCYLSASGWAELRDGIAQNRHIKYGVVPMHRLTDTACLADPDFRPEALEEPQLVFRCDASETFDEAYYYGRRPKVELFWRLGVAGSWDLSNDDHWDLPRPSQSEEAGQLARIGWVARLPSGMAELELPSRLGQIGREAARNQAIIATLDGLDLRAFQRGFKPLNLSFYDPVRLAGLRGAEAGSAAAEVRARVVAEAEAALDRGPYSVVDKQSLPPSGDPHDYWHPAPYWWPNPATLDGLPYVRRDGVRVPGTELYEPLSERYDRSRLQRLFDDTTVLALGWAASGDDRFAEHAAGLVRCWFVDPATRMNPHLGFAQIRLGHDLGDGWGFGVIEFKDVYFFLDAVRLLRRAGSFTDVDDGVFKTWLTDYLSWLDTSPQGRAERAATNNHGTCYDLQTAAIAVYLGDSARLIETLRTSRERLLRQFGAGGDQPEELARTQPLHYVAFNLQSWVNLAALAGRCGDRLAWFSPREGGGLGQALDWGLHYLASNATGSGFDASRSLPLRAARLELGGESPRLDLRRPLFHPHDGVAPFWALGQEIGPRTEVLPREVGAAGVAAHLVGN